MYVVITFDDVCHGPFDTYEKCYKWAVNYHNSRSNESQFSIYEVHNP